jgi:hypothetical protein
VVACDKLSVVACDMSSLGVSLKYDHRYSICKMGDRGFFVLKIKISSHIYFKNTIKISINHLSTLKYLKITKKNKNQLNQKNLN